MLSRPVLATAAIRATEFICSGSTLHTGEEQFSAYTLALVAAGSFEFQRGRQRAHLVPGALLVGAPGVAYRCHHDHVHIGDRCLSFHFDPELVDSARSRPIDWQRGALQPCRALSVLGARALALARLGDATAITEAALDLLSSYAEQVSDRPADTHRTGARQTRRVLDCALWIDTHAATRITLADMAGACGMSLFHFVRLFSRVLGVSPHQYLVRARLRRAAGLLLESPASITEIALDSGFADLSNFLRCFRQSVRCSPRQFRLRHRRSASFAKS